MFRCVPPPDHQIAPVRYSIARFLYSPKNGYIRFWTNVPTSAQALTVRGRTLPTPNSRPAVGKTETALRRANTVCCPDCQRRVNTERF